MPAYGVSDVERVLQMSRGTIRSLIKAGFVSPARGPHREYLFSFQDLIVLRTARALNAAKVSPRRITHSLKQLRERLPAQVPLSGLTICAVGDRVVVQEGSRRWQADSGQYLLALDVSVSGGELSLLVRGAPAVEVDAGEPDAEDWFNQGWELEKVDTARARRAYERALEIEPAHAGASINLGRLWHEAGQLARAERAYRAALERNNEDALLLFNLAVVLEDAGRGKEALPLYEAALAIDPKFADAHYNLALAYEAAGDARRAIRHLGEYRKLTRER
jgi:tetratricopeptide (TPR) repeat protein